MGKKTGDQRKDNFEKAVSRYSEPSKLKITDLRTAVVASNYDYPLIRIDTNQDVYGIGEVRDAGHREDALRFKNFLIGQNPCDVDRIFNTIKQFGGSGREGGGVSGIEIALWDLVGKVYGVPCYQFLGGKYRKQVRVYADTPEPEELTPEGYAERVEQRRGQGFDFIKFDLGFRCLEEIDGGLVGPPPAPEKEIRFGGRHRARGSRSGIQLSGRGIDYFAEIVAAVRETVGWEVSLAIDHLGPVTIKDAIRLGKALEPYALSWLEDLMPWWDVEANKRVTEAINIPTLNGEDIYLWDGWREIIEERAIDIIQPDLLSAGGMNETKKIADYAERYGLPTVLHCASSPIGFLANVHCAAALSSFTALEAHWLDLPFWKDLVTGFEEDLLEGCYIEVPERPGLGLDLNYEGIRENLRKPGLFEPTDEWDDPKLGFWQP